MQDFIENVIERSIFASRWLLAPVYLVLSISLAFVAIKVVQEFLHFVPHVMENNLKELMLFLLHIVVLSGHLSQYSNLLKGIFEYCRGNNRHIIQEESVVTNRA